MKYSYHLLINASYIQNFTNGSLNSLISQPVLVWGGRVWIKVRPVSTHGIYRLRDQPKENLRGREQWAIDFTHSLFLSHSRTPSPTSAPLSFTSAAIATALLTRAAHGKRTGQRREKSFTPQLIWTNTSKTHTQTHTITLGHYTMLYHKTNLQVNHQHSKPTYFSKLSPSASLLLCT